MPGLAHFVAAPDVRDDVDHAPVQQAEAGNGESGGGTIAVRPVGIEEEGRAAVPFHTLPVHHGERHLRTIPGRGPEAFRGVLGPVIAAQNLGFLEQGLLPGGHVAVVDALGRDHGLVDEAEGLGGVFGRPPGGGRVDGLGEGDLPPGAGLEVLDAEPLQALALLGHHQEVPEGFDAFEQHVDPMGDEDLPMLRIWCGRGSSDQAEVLRALVGADVEGPATVLHIVLVALLPGEQDLEGARGLRGGQIAGFPGVRGLAFHQEILVILGAPHEHPVEFVLLLEDELGCAVREVQAPELVRALRARVLGGEEHVPAIAGPGIGSHPFGQWAAHPARGQVLGEELILAESRRVRAVEQGVIVIADDEGTQSKEVQALGQFVLV